MGGAGRNPSYNKTGFYVFLGTLAFSCLWACWFLVFHNTVDLGEYDKTAGPLAGISSDLSQEERDRPWLSSEKLVAHGAKVYRAQCALCHGPKGLGDGSPGLVPPPRDLVEGKWARGGSSKAMFITLQEGIEGTSMLSFKHLPALDRWAVIHYVRSLTQNKTPDNKEELEAFGLQAK